MGRRRRRRPRRYRPPGWGLPATSPRKPRPRRECCGGGCVRWTRHPRKQCRRGSSTARPECDTIYARCRPGGGDDAGVVGRTARPESADDVRHDQGGASASAGTGRRDDREHRFNRWTERLTDVAGLCGGEGGRDFADEVSRPRLRRRHSRPRDRAVSPPEHLSRERSRPAAVPRGRNGRRRCV